MSPNVISIDIDRAPAEVFAYTTAPRHSPDWRNVASVQLEGNPMTVGARVTTTRRIAGAEQTLVQEVIEVDPPKRWAVRAVGGPIRPNGMLTFEPLDSGARTRVIFAIDY